MICSLHLFINLFSSIYLQPVHLDFIRLILTFKIASTSLLSL